MTPQEIGREIANIMCVNWMYTTAEANHLEELVATAIQAERDALTAAPPAKFAGQTEPGQRAATVAEITKAVREADEDFRHVGGSTRHWVRDCFIPALDAAWMRVVVNPPASPRTEVEGE